MGDVNRTSENEAESEVNSRKKRIQVFESILNYCKGRSLSLDIIFASKQVNTSIPPNMRTSEELQKNILCVQEDISVIQSLKECVKLINNSLTCQQITQMNNSRMMGKILHKIEGIIYFSKSIMKLYSKRYSELDLIEKKKSYLAALAAYEEHLNSVRESEEELNAEDAEVLKKAELQICKINFVRVFKQILIGYIAVNRPDILPEVQQFRTPVRRNLTLEDFNDTWDVGLTS